MDDDRYELEQRIDHVTNESLDATRRIRQVAEETHGMGVETLVTLNEQGEKLDNAERRLDEINVDLKQTDRNLQELEKCCGCCVCPHMQTRNMQKTKGYKKVYGKKAQAREMDAVTNQPHGSSGPSGGVNPEGPYIKRVTNDDREVEMEENLTAVSDVLTNLKGIAGDMGDELDRQNTQLDRLNKKMDVNTVHLEQANYRIRRQL